MKTALKPDLKSKISFVSKSYPRLVEKEVSLVNFKFYQKLFVFFLAFLTILIFPESQKNWKIYVRFITLEKYVMFGSQAALYSDSSFS